MPPLRVAMTMEQCWHRVPGGTAVAARNILAELVQRPDDVQVTAVTVMHRRPPSGGSLGVAQRSFPLPQPLLYDLWGRTGLPRVDWLVPQADLVHATTILVPSAGKPLVVTIHDLAFLHEPSRFTTRGNRLFRSGLDQVKRSAAVVLCSSQATLDDCERAGIETDRLRLVPLGVRQGVAADDAEIAQWLSSRSIADEFVLFVGTLEPRKNLSGLLQAFARLRADGFEGDLVIVGPTGWGEAATVPDGVARHVHSVGQLSDHVLTALYQRCLVFAYPSHQEGFGLPILEAMVNGAPVVTSAVSSTAEVAGDAAVLVDPTRPDDIAQGILDAARRRTELAASGRARAATFSWSRTADLTVAAYRDAVSA